MKTPRAIPTVVLRSAVATVRRCSTPNSLAAAGSASTGRMSMKFSRNAAGGAARGEGECENEQEGNEESKNDAVDVHGPKRTVPRIHGVMSQVMLDVARHPARSFFLCQICETHKSPIVI